jgi:glutamine amidotransferase
VSVWLPGTSSSVSVILTCPSWFAYVSESEQCLLEDVLITPKHSLANQVHDHYLPKLLHYDPNNITTEREIDIRNKLFNIDGLGVAWYTTTKSDFTSPGGGSRPAMYKTVSPPLSDFNFRSICANTATNAVFAHIRATSGTSVMPANNHPFVFGRHAFMHNGEISDFISVRREMCALLDKDVYAHILGSTDSEHLGALYMTFLTNGRGRASWEEVYSIDEMKEALKRAMGKVMELQQVALGVAREPNDLNLATTDGQQLLCVRFRNHATEQPPSLYYSETAGVTLNRKYPDGPEGNTNLVATKTNEECGKHIIVASEPTTYKEEDWHIIKKNNCLTFTSTAGLTIEKIDYPREWDTSD